MNDLLVLVLQAHGGLERWLQFQAVEATFESGGELLARKSPQPPGLRRVIAQTRTQSIMASRPGMGGDPRDLLPIAWRSKMRMVR